MISMTGYAYKEFQNEKLRLTLELKTYNNRYLDLIFNIPSVLSPLEGNLRKTLGEYLERGRVELYIRLKELEENISLIIDKEAVKSYQSSLEELKTITGITQEISLDQILKQEGVLKVDKKRDLEGIKEILMPLLNDALEDLKKTRAMEGESLEKDILSQINFLQSRVKQIKELAPLMEKSIKENLVKKFEEVLGNKVDENRILSEMAVQLVRFDINEELVRLDTHFKSFLDIVYKENLVGKKLDFLCQEINREINTIGSKSTLVEINQIVVEMKDSLEKVREQLKNVE